MRKGILASFLVLYFSTRCYAWGTKEHILLTRLAAEGLIADPKTPEEMKNWLRKAAPDVRDIEGEKRFLLEAHIGVFPRGADGLSFWSVVPDLNRAVDGQGDRARKIEPFDVPEALLHYINLEFFFPIDAQRSYVDDLSHKPSFNDVPRDMTDPRWKRSGMLPFRVEQCYKELVEQISKGRLVDTPGQYPRDEHAQMWAGMLAHYAEDNTQPQHSTADYMSQSYFKQLFRGPNVHTDVESRLVDDEGNDYTELRREFWDVFAKSLNEVRDPIDTDDPWAATLQVSLLSYDALPLIGHAAEAAYSHEGEGWKFDAVAFYHFKGTYHGKEITVMQMKADQMGWAVKRVQRLWRKAWEEAQAGKH